MTEIKNAITKSWFHIIRFGGLLLIPFIYGFSYIYAFYDPFTKVDQVQISMVTNKGDYLADAIGRQSAKSSEIEMGDIKMTMKMEHIYYESDDQLEKVKKDSYATVRLNDLSSLDKAVGGAIATQMKTGILKAGSLAQGLTQAFNDIMNKMLADKKDFEFTLNYKKNYLLAFGIDTGASMTSTIAFIQKMLINSLNDPNYLQHIYTTYIKNNILILPANKPADFPAFQQLANNIAHDMLETLEKSQPIKVEAHMGEHAKYGYGLAPFFISVAMWIGGMVMTFAIHRKIYDKTIPAGKRYFAKWLIIIFGIIMQATILMVSLYLIGFDELGIDHWFSLYIGAIICGIIFSSIIQAIRFSIHDRTIGILLTIMLLVLQMASGGGLFPIETQSGFYKFINNIVPMGWSVKILRELSFGTNWSNVFIDFGFLSIWLFIVPVGVVINHYRTVRIYSQNNWPLPETMAYWEYVRQQKKKAKKASKGGDE